MEIKRALVAGYLELLHQAAGIENGNWGYAVSRNIKRLDAIQVSMVKEYKARFTKQLDKINVQLKKEKKAILDPRAYQKASYELIEKYSWYEEIITVKEKGKDVKKENKKQFLDGGRPSVHSSKKEQYEKEAAILEEKNIEEKIFIDGFNKDFDVYLDKPVNVEFYLVGEEGIPKTFSANDLLKFDFMLKD